MLARSRLLCTQNSLIVERSLATKRLAPMPVEPASPERAEELRENYDKIAREVEQATQRRGAGPTPRLVTVSKYKPASDILALYEHGVRHFGENYPQELEGKAQELPNDIAWHFIGTLQSNKCKMLAGEFSPTSRSPAALTMSRLRAAIPNLFAIETLTSVKAANHLHNALSSLPSTRSEPLNVFIQINTSGEEQKSGLAALTSSSSSGEAVDLALHILDKCPTLRLKGLMTIGSLDASKSATPNPDFERLKETRDRLGEVLRSKAQSDGASEGLRKGVEQIERDGGLELSMGMSSDFVEAIEQGSTNVRVGSSIMGSRPPKQ
ncbi:cytoplasmic protein [Rhodotorula toruloides]|uniref:Pyridoxal phosphate homeostasis protein n=1 Tax=Rhodotorula toruloides TaxID=5286 RepID=A0A2T0AG73_RHOTO|nr:cytoplasmic protein [Rhodotorula toruloides]